MSTSTRPFTGTPRRLSVDSRTELSTSTPWVNSILRRTQSTSNTLEELIDVENDLTVFSNDQLSILNPTTLYRSGIFRINTGLYRHHREEILSIPDGKQQVINLMTPGAIRELRRKNYRLIHLGLMVIGVRGLTRQKIGAKLLLCLVDTRHAELEKAILGTMEVDLNNNSEIVYLSPNYAMDITDFGEHFKILVQVKGFENFIGKNILLDINFLGKCMTKHNPKMKIKLDEVVKALTSKGIRFLKPMEIDSSSSSRN